MTLNDSRKTRWRTKFMKRFGYDLKEQLGYDWVDLSDSDLQEMYDDMVEDEKANKFGGAG